MTHLDETIWCDGCGVEIDGPPVVVGKNHYCCKDCSQGLKCSCLNWAEEEDDHLIQGQEAELY